MEREIKLHIKLNHSSIIKLYSVFEDDKLVYMVLEQALGGDLFDALNNAGGRLSERVAVQAVLVPTLQALEYLHSKVTGGWEGARCGPPAGVDPAGETQEACGRLRRCKLAMANSAVPAQGLPT